MLHTFRSGRSKTMINFALIKRISDTAIPFDLLVAAKSVHKFVDRFAG